MGNKDQRYEGGSFIKEKKEGFNHTPILMSNMRAKHSSIVSEDPERVEVNDFQSPRKDVPQSR